MIINDWLEDHIEERRFDLGTTDDPQEFAMLAGVLRSEAAAYGYRMEDLEEVCDGDIPTYLMMKQRPWTSENHLNAVRSPSEFIAA